MFFMLNICISPLRRHIRVASSLTYTGRGGGSCRIFNHGWTRIDTDFEFMIYDGRERLLPSRHLEQVLQVGVILRRRGGTAGELFDMRPKFEDHVELYNDADENTLPQLPHFFRADNQEVFP